MATKILIWSSLVLIVIGLVAINVYVNRDKRVRAARGEDEPDTESWIW